MNPILLTDKRVDAEIRQIISKRIAQKISQSGWDDLKREVRSSLMKWGKTIAEEKRKEIREVADALALLCKKGTEGPGLEEAKNRLKKRYEILLKKNWEIVDLKQRAENWECEKWASGYLISKQ